MVTRVPLSAADQALVRQHVPESVLGQLGDWQSQIPLAEAVSYYMDTTASQVSVDLHNKLFFTRDFYDARSASRRQDVTCITQGVALVFFKYNDQGFTGLSGGGRRCNWSVHAFGFENGVPFGEYFRERIGVLGKSNSFVKRDFRDKYDKIPEDILDVRIPNLLREARKAGAQVFPRALPVPVPVQLPVAPVVPEPVQPAPAEVGLPPAPAIETPRAWYQVIGDALSSCIASLVDCFLRFFETLRVRG